MQVLALSRRLPGVTTEQLQPLEQPEAAAAYRLMMGGHLRNVHMLPERPGAMLILEANDIAHAQQLLGGLPMVEQGLITFDLSRMLPYPALGSLFAPEYRVTP
jgi:hypothetical protein